MTETFVRRALEVARTRMADEPVLLLEGPRAVGKSTLLRGLAKLRGSEVTDLDEIAVRDIVAADPGFFVSGARPVFLDECQKVPILLDAIKAELNIRSSGGAFVLAGSTRYDALPVAGQSLTGRLNRLSVLPLPQTEIEGTSVDLVQTVFEDASSTIRHENSTTTRDDYIEHVCRGGFPMVIARNSQAARNRWFDDYIKLTLERDARELSRIRRAAALPRLLGRLAGQTAQVLNIARAAAEVGLEVKTADDYLRLLEALFLIEQVPAWEPTLTSRSAAKPKLHVLDTGVAARLMQLTRAKLARRDPTSMTEFGRLLETFVMGELQRHASWLDGIANVSHWRTRDDIEVNVVIERDDGAVIASEVKTGARVAGGDLEPMSKLRDAVGERFLAGAVLYTGARSYTLEDRIHVMPIDRLWGLRPGS